jgi:hypothetical protein
MIRSTIQAEFDLFFPRMAPAPLMGDALLANALRCAEEDVSVARSEYLIRRRQIAMANRHGAKIQDAAVRTHVRKLHISTAFWAFNKARRALDRAEAALAALLPRH